MKYWSFLANSQYFRFLPNSKTRAEMVSHNSLLGVFIRVVFLFPAFWLVSLSERIRVEHDILKKNEIACSNFKEFEITDYIVYIVDLGKQYELKAGRMQKKISLEHRIVCFKLKLSSFFISCTFFLLMLLYMMLIYVWQPLWIFEWIASSSVESWVISDMLYKIVFSFLIFTLIFNLILWIDLDRWSVFWGG